MTELQEEVVHVVRSIPSGRVMSYGQVALAIGVPRGARLVGRILRSLPHESQCPWWRVTNTEGRLSIKGNSHATAGTQKRLLEHEGVPIRGDYTFDSERFRL